MGDRASPRGWALCSRPRDHWQESSPGEIGQRVEGNAPEQKSPRVGGGKERLVKAEGR